MFSEKNKGIHMDELQTAQITEILGRQAWQSVENRRLAVKHRPDGHAVAIADEGL